METRSERKKKKNKRPLLRKLLLLFSLLIIAGVGYFWIGYQSALENEPEKKKPTYEFNGIEDPEGKTNVLLIGVDSRGEEQSRSDTIMIAQYDADTKTPKLVSIMRDSYVDIPGHGKNKINNAYFFGGPELLRKTIKENFDVDVQYYSIVDFKGFEKMVDIVAPDGIEINVEKKMSYNIGVTLEPGLQRLNGKELLGYARFRHDARSDFARVERQQEVITKLKDEVISLNGLAQLPELAGTLQSYVDTNIKTSTVLGIGKDFVLKKTGSIQTLRIPIDNGFTETTRRGAGDVLELDLEKNQQALKEFLG